MRRRRREKLLWVSESWSTSHRFYIPNEQYMIQCLPPVYLKTLLLDTLQYREYLQPTLRRRVRLFSTAYTSRLTHL
jgi:hypothetical protein